MTADITAIRKELASVPNDVSASVAAPPRPDDVYAPARHAAALDPDRSLVVGSRGAGKTFWSAAYLQAETRQLMAAEYPALRLHAVSAVAGFTGEEGGDAPSPRFLMSLTDQAGGPENLWRVVFLQGLGRALGSALDWDVLVRLVHDVWRSEQLFREFNEILQRNRIVIVFDGLDRIATDWRTARLLVGGLMRVILDLRPYQSLRPKAFLRPDQFEDQEIFGFVDASKLKADVVRLDWRPIDLYGLLFTRLARSEVSRPAFGVICGQHGEPLPPITPGTPAALPDRLRRDPVLQESVFRSLAGPYMGSDHRRGRTYTWLPAHLADARGDVSPRSFLRALREAAEHTASYASKTPLDALGLRAGVRAASKVRLEQLQEDYKWASHALAPLADLKVPCGEQEFIERWREENTVSSIVEAAKRASYLGPVEFETSAKDQEWLLLQALIRLGVVERRADGRINMPDIYRVAAQLLRKGGVPPQDRGR